MKNIIAITLCFTVILSGCGQSAQEKLAEKQLEDRKRAEEVGQRLMPPTKPTWTHKQGM